MPDVDDVDDVQRQRQQHRKVAIIGCGITGALAASTLIQKCKNDNTNNDQGGLTIHVFDQGRGGVGGRASSRSAFPSSTQSSSSTLSNKNDDVTTMSSSTNMLRWDHGCQFFRADTPRFQCIVQEWLDKGYAQVWNGNFTSIRCNNYHREDDEEGTGSDRSTEEYEFFGLPSHPPFYVGSNGMQSLITNVMDDAAVQHQSSLSSSLSESSLMRVFAGTRVAKLQRLTNDKWKLVGNCGIAAYHDTPEHIVQQQQQQQHQKAAETDEDGYTILGDESGYDVIILTDISSSFEAWHRASAGVPPSFALSVRERVGARVPLFSTMIAYNTPQSSIPYVAISFIDHPIIWFAAKSNSKPGMMLMQEQQNDNDNHNEVTTSTTTSEMNNDYECWTIVSTPEYAMNQIESTPMQNEKTGEFIPQSKDYLTTVPGPDMVTAFESILLTNYPNIIGPSLPKIVHLDAQRWGSALPCARQLTIQSATRKVISGVPYDSGRYPLAPTKMERHESELSYLADEGMMLFQAGDMMSSFTPGFEGAALSGCDVAERVAQLIFGSND